MKKYIIRFIYFVIGLFLFVAVFNYLEMNFFRKSLKENYIDETYLRPNFVDEFKKLKKRNTEDSMLADSQKNFDDFIVDKSKWIVADKDISSLREEWHYRLYDFIKAKFPEDAESIFKDYLEIKNQEVESMKKLEENFLKVKKELKDKYNGVEDGRFYKDLHKQIHAKKQLGEQTRNALMERKKEILGNKVSSEIIELRKQFTLKVNHRLMYEFNLTEIEAIQAKSEMLHKYYYLTF